MPTDDYNSMPITTDQFMHIWTGLLIRNDKHPLKFLSLCFDILCAGTVIRPGESSEATVAADALMSSIEEEVITSTVASSTTGADNVMSGEMTDSGNIVNRMSMFTQGSSPIVGGQVGHLLFGEK